MVLIEVIIHSKVTIIIIFIVMNIFIIFFSFLNVFVLYNVDFFLNWLRFTISGVLDNF